ncbi:MAG TPA: hypothetical protein VFW40_13890 [Capsulimonadaceae bacterium]|nr:hypothetical protein [Capsulimonadaceae bacterium]
MSYESGADTRPATLEITTSNGFVIESFADHGLDDAGDLVHAYSVRGPDGKTQWCHVLLPERLAMEIDDYAGADRSCERSRFLLAVCEKALASHLLQRERLPDDGFLAMDALSDPIKNWIDTVLCRPTPHPAMDAPALNLAMDRTEPIKHK